jgi:multidrug resistance efflux pump
MAALPVTHEPASQRLHFRVSAPAEVCVAGLRCTTLDWSLGGFRIARYAGNASVCDRLHVEFALDFQGFRISFHACAEVLRRENDQLAAKWIELGERESSLLRRFVSDVIGGRLAAVDGVLKHIDRPVTKVSLVETTEPAAARNYRAWRRALVSTIYLLLGVALVAFALWTASQAWMSVNVETAVTAMQLEQVVSIDAGAIRELNVIPGAEVKTGQVLLKVDSEVASRNLDVARQDLKSAEADLALAHELAQQEKARMAAYRVIGGDQLDLQDSKIDALTAARDEARVDFERVKKLWEYGIVARQVYDSQEAAANRLEAEVKAAQAEQKIIASSNRSIDSGFFFSGNFLVGELQARMAQVEAAQQRVIVAQNAVRDAMHQEQKHEYRAPFDGVVMRVFKSVGTTVDRGEPVMVLRKHGEEAHIDAYLTQEEVGRITTGSPAVASLPAIGKRYTVEVAMVDRTSGFLKEIQTPKLQQPRWEWRDSEDRTAYVRLNFVGVSSSELVSMQPGLPVQVTIPRAHHWLFHLANLPVVQATSMQASRLWPTSSPIFDADAAKYLPHSVFERILEAAGKAEGMPAAPVKLIHSAGETDQLSPEFAASRRAFQDADNFLFLLMAYRLTGKSHYRESALAVVNAWARVNQPTGQPIDETRLETFLWGLDLLGPEADNAPVRAWLEKWSAATHAYSFGPKTESNNYMTHHLKIALMLDRYLGRSADYERDLAAAVRLEKVNLGSADGSSLDYRERDAMHYHIFDLEAWTEIALVTGCCRSSIDRAFVFFEKQMREHPEHIEFANSTAPIDRKRASGGFEYAKGHPYEINKASRAIFAYATLGRDSRATDRVRSVPPAIWDAAARGATHSNLFYEARYYLWQPR